ncbi:NmrA family NAD(P)-binding protein [Catellatospora sp. NPDC049609]|uniref:NmrA family NAD(P)-binding protein n=1 Tax=Catellatospora sp. NPDC049609 TaxID=3155505 RepID=UPI00341D63B1
MGILVTGASGNVGTVVARALTDSGAAVVAATRSGRAVGGARGVVFDFTDAATWPGAFADIESMLLVRPPAVGNVRRDLLPALSAARAHGMRHVVFLSLQGAERNRLVPHATVEAWLRGSGMRWTFLRAGFFCQNLSTVHAADIRDQDRIMVPAGDGATSFVDAHDIGHVAAAALLDPGTHAGRAWTLTGPHALTYHDVAALLSAELGRTIAYPRPGALAYARHARHRLRMPWPMVAVTTAIYTTARLGLAAAVTGDVRAVLGRDPIDFAEFAHRERDSWTTTPGRHT